MWIPNPNGALRVYTMLSNTDLETLEISAYEAAAPSTREKTNTTTLDIFSARPAPVIAPYSIKIQRVNWISRYTVAQRLISSFSDDDRVFILGDAAHTHSPKAGQGMNISMQDSYNLTWKLGLILQEFASSSLLATYNEERHLIAQQLVDFESKFSSLFGAKDRFEDPEFREVWAKGKGFTSGCGHQHAPGRLVDGTVSVAIDQKAIELLTTGKKLLTMNLVTHPEGRLIDLADDLASFGRFHFFIFAGQAFESGPRATKVLQGLCENLAGRGSVLQKYGNPKTSSTEWGFEDVRNISSNQANEGKVVDLFIVHTLDHSEVNTRDMSELLGRDWKHRIYEDTGGEEHRRHGVDPEKGALAIVRPDLVCGIEECHRINTWFEKALGGRDDNCRNGIASKVEKQTGREQE